MPSVRVRDQRPAPWSSEAATAVTPLSPGSAGASTASRPCPRTGSAARPGLPCRPPPAGCRPPRTPPSRPPAAARPAAVRAPTARGSSAVPLRSTRPSCSVVCPSRSHQQRDPHAVRRHPYRLDPPAVQARHRDLLAGRRCRSRSRSSRGSSRIAVRHPQVAQPVPAGRGQPVARRLPAWLVSTRLAAFGARRPCRRRTARGRRCATPAASPLVARDRRPTQRGRRPRRTVRGTGCGSRPRRPTGVDQPVVRRR